MEEQRRQQEERVRRFKSRLFKLFALSAAAVFAGGYLAKNHILGMTGYVMVIIGMLLLVACAKALE